MNDFREYSDYLMHYGIPGQRRGIRRYQNEDGTLTPEGKRRYLVNAERSQTGVKGFSPRDSVLLRLDSSYRNGHGVLGLTDYRPGHDPYPNDSKNIEYVRLSEYGASTYKHDKAVRKAAEILENIEHSWKVFTTHREELGKEASEKRENRVQDIEDKIHNAEKKVKDVFKKFKLF